jgi:hypothetical protein
MPCAQEMPELLHIPMPFPENAIFQWIIQGFTNRGQHVLPSELQVARKTFRMSELINVLRNS